MNTNHIANDIKESIQSGISTNILMRHLNSFIENDLETLMLDYTDESVFITQDATYTGISEIKGFFTNLVIHFPKQQCTFELDKLVVKNELGFIVWHANTPSLVVSLGTDTFIIKDEKIIQQTFAGQMNYIT